MSFLYQVKVEGKWEDVRGRKAAVTKLNLSESKVKHCLERKQTSIIRVKPLNAEDSPLSEEPPTEDANSHYIGIVD